MYKIWISNVNFNRVKNKDIYTILKKPDFKKKYISKNKQK